MTQISKNQFIKYVLVGGWNTIFGYAVYALLTWILDARYHVCYSYMYSYVIGNIISISQSFIAHKYLVFKTKGNFWKEYKKGWLVYGTTALLSFIALPFTVELCSFLLSEPYKWLDKYIGGIAVTGIAAIAGFLGHSNITFRQGE